MPKQSKAHKIKTDNAVSYFQMVVLFFPFIFFSLEM